MSSKRCGLSQRTARSQPLGACPLRTADCESRAQEVADEHRRGWFTCSKPLELAGRPSSNNVYFTVKRVTRKVNGVHFQGPPKDSLEPCRVAPRLRTLCAKSPHHTRERQSLLRDGVAFRQHVLKDLQSTTSTRDSTKLECNVTHIT